MPRSAFVLKFVLNRWWRGMARYSVLPRRGPSKQYRYLCRGWYCLMSVCAWICWRYWRRYQNCFCGLEGDCSPDVCWICWLHWIQWMVGDVELPDQQSQFPAKSCCDKMMIPGWRKPIAELYAPCEIRNFVGIRASGQCFLSRHCHLCWYRERLNECWVQWLW